MKNLIERTFFGALYVAVIIAGILWLPQYVFIGIFAIIMALALYEYYKLLNMGKIRTIGVIIFGELIYAIFTIGSALTIPHADTICLVLFILCWIVPFAMMVAEHWQQQPINRNSLVTNFIAAMFWIIMPISFLPYMLVNYPLVLLALFVIIWTNDTGAYCIGTLTAKLPGGNHKMAPKTSPKKSWEGLCGGILFALIAGYIFSLYVTEYTWWQWLLFALFVALVGTWGDLIESHVKRRAGVKDSGRFLPGHGGVLDRFDSLLLCLLVLAAIRYFMDYFVRCFS